MSQSRLLQQHIVQLGEIRSILHALKNMAFMDMHKLTKFQQAQHRVVEQIESVAGDFLSVYPSLPELMNGYPKVIVVIGAERGFCGNFNESLIEQIPALHPDIVIAVGSRLSARLHRANFNVIELPGANSSDEITRVLENLSGAITDLHRNRGLFSLSVLFHRNEHLDITEKPLVPPFQNLTANNKDKLPPLLHMEPAEFLLELTEHYVLSSLQDVLYTSLSAENNQRLQHLDNAVNHLDEEVIKKRKKSQIYRQEEITEEIEVILLNAEG